MTPDEKRIVDWLRTAACRTEGKAMRQLVAIVLKDLADAIERGEHLKG